MDNLIIKENLGNIMDKSRDALLLEDEIYIHDSNDKRSENHQAQESIYVRVAVTHSELRKKSMRCVWIAMNNLLQRNYCKKYYM